MAKYFSPRITDEQFHCPHCGVYADQVWFAVVGRPGEWKYSLAYPPPSPHVTEARDPLVEKTFDPRMYEPAGSPYVHKPDPNEKILPRGSNDLVLHSFYFSVCVKCEKPVMWRDHMMIHPVTGGIEPPSPDLNEDIRSDYDEAAGIIARSPRGAAALLRLCVQKLCKQLGLPGKNLNADIAALVKQGLTPTVQKALDALRVIGNNAVHPLHMDLRDDRETALKLFGAINFIADQMITQKQQLEDLFRALPEATRAEIKKRDGNS